jgi:hypothetical protein
MTKVILSKPIAIGPQIFTALTFRRPVLGDLPLIIKASSLADLDDIVILVSRLADIPLEAACAVDPDDIATVLTALGEHLEKSMPRTPKAA